MGLLLSTFIDFLVDFAHLFAPKLSFPVRQVDNRVAIPMHVISQEGYLLIDALQGVAYDPPGLIFTSTVSLQFKHRVFSVNASPPVLL
jgi:hypothetical protein